jgi:hypothetical protein
MTRPVGCVAPPLSFPGTLLVESDRSISWVDL